jgi:TRAP-type uncharacterized transport system substrate-binding protein
LFAVFAGGGAGPGACADSLANVNGIAGGAMESGFSQADVATWAQKGTGIFEGKPNVPACA